MKITKHAQSCFLVEGESTRVLIDPGRFVFEDLEGLSPEYFRKIDVLILTHEHRDHFSPPHLKIILENNKPLVLTSESLKEKMSEEGLQANIEIIGKGVDKTIGEFNILGSASTHGPLPNGNTPPEVIGVLITDGKTSFYHPGDTLFLDPDCKADIVATPICGTVVMNIEQAKEELKKLEPKIAIPIHYDNPDYPVSVEDFKEAMTGTSTEVKILENGQSLI